MILVLCCGFTVCAVLCCGFTVCTVLCCGFTVCTVLCCGFVLWFCAVVSQCVQFFPVVSQCVHFCAVVSQCVQFCACGFKSCLLVCGDVLGCAEYVEHSQCPSFSENIRDVLVLVKLITVFILRLLCRWQHY